MEKFLLPGWRDSEYFGNWNSNGNIVTEIDCWPSDRWPKVFLLAGPMRLIEDASSACAIIKTRTYPIQRHFTFFRSCPIHGSRFNRRHSFIRWRVNTSRSQEEIIGRISGLALKMVVWVVVQNCSKFVHPIGSRIFYLFFDISFWYMMEVWIKKNFFSNFLGWFDFWNQNEIEENDLNFGLVLIAVLVSISSLFVLIWIVWSWISFDVWIVIKFKWWLF